MEPENLDIRQVGWLTSVWFAWRIVIHVLLGGRLYIALADRSCMAIFGIRIGGGEGGSQL